MSQDKELEIQLQFLEEAQEYLDTIESVLLDLAGGHIDGQKMDAVLRAAHSVKGGAGMMGFQTLSQLAHRLEDSFKVLKVQRNSLKVDAELESLLLQGVDRLRQVLASNRKQTEVDEQWLATVGNPVFEKLHERLGDPKDEDAATILGTEDGTNVAALLFETEVEGCLVRLESVLDDPQMPCLEEELLIMAQELEGLGEMLQLGAFSNLCRSVVQHLETAPEQVEKIAQLALQSWRRSQALVLVGQVNSLPTQLDFISDTAIPATESATVSTPTEAAQEDWAAAELAQEDWVPAEVAQEDWVPAEVAQEDWAAAEVAQEDWQDLEVLAAEFETSSPVAETEDSSATEDELEERVAVFSQNASFYREVQNVSQSEAQERIGATEVQAADVKWQEVQRDSKSSEHTNNVEKPVQENTVRIPVRQLEQLSDLFGELTIERNGLSLHLGRLRNLMETLKSRVSNLEQSNIHLRTAYDTVATQASVVGSGLTVPMQSLAATAANKRRVPPEASNNPAGIQYPFSNLLNSSHLIGPDDLNAFNPRISDRGIAQSASEEQPWTGEELVGHDDLLDEGSEDISSKFDVLEMDRYSDLHLLSREVMETIVQIQEVTSDIELRLEDTEQTGRELNRTAKQLQTNLTRVRMRPLSEIVGRFSRALRDLSFEYGKQVELKVVGKGTLIDRSILEALSDPLMHLVRNAFDHGIEKPEKRKAQGKPPKGAIEIKAAHRGNQTLITISDDGNGINLDKIRARAEEMGLDAELLAAASEDDLLSLIFEPGFSTAEQVTALSGRGVGMDVVRNNLKQIRGDIRVDTSPGRGTTFTLTVPFTLSVARILLVESNGMLLAFPTDVVEEMLLLQPEQILKTPGSEVLNWEGEMIRLIRLGEWLTFHCPRRITIPDGVPSISEPTVMMVSQGEQLVGLQVDRCWGEREVAVRQVEGILAMPSGFASCAILGDGKAIPMVDVSEMLDWIASFESPSSVVITSNSVSASPRGYLNQAVTPQSNQRKLPELNPSFDAWSQNRPPALAIPQSKKDTILVVDDSINVRRFLALALEKAGYLVEQAKDGQDAVDKLLSGLKVQAVICDIEMPRLDGYGFLARIKSDPLFGDLPIAMLTSRSGEKHRQLAMTLGATAYFSKPYNERVLLKTLEELISPKVTA
ncbi:response regulator [Lyngbya aestuarii]|uniref:response regulator n=1 Tax=Lyngbya aestuarii TaxID=118322 RepID=UPI00403D989F